MEQQRGRIFPTCLSVCLSRATARECGARRDRTEDDDRTTTMGKRKDASVRLKQPGLVKSPDDEGSATEDLRQAKKRAVEKSANERAGVAAILVFILLRFAQRLYTATEARYITTTLDQPLTVRKDNFLSFTEYAKLKECALGHPKLRVKGGLNDAGFSKTRGFVVKFNLEGEEKFRSHGDYQCFVDVFDKLRLPDANAFVMNILLCELGEYDEYNADELSVGLHLDTTVGIYSRHMFIAHQVSVLYNSVPSDMEGGNLELFPYGDGYPDTGAPPEESVAPKENLLVTFRGDAFHQVRSYRTKTGSERISLVLEQYKIDEDMYPKTIKFLEAYKSNMTMM